MEQVRGHTATGCTPPAHLPFVPCHSPQIQCLQEGPAGRAGPRVWGIKQQQARVTEGGKHPLPAPPDARGPWHLGKAGMGGPARPKPPTPISPSLAPAHRQEALVGSACACFRVHSQGCAEEFGGHRAGWGL